MIKITGYKQVNYSDFKQALNEAFQNCGKQKIHVAASVNVSTPTTISNALEGDPQMVSDRILTSVMLTVGLDGFVVWLSGKKYYYIKSK